MQGKVLKIMIIINYWKIIKIEKVVLKLLEYIYKIITY